MELSKITIIIPSFNRQKFLLRQIYYWKNSGAQLILLDGSETPIENRLFKSSFDKKNMIYINSNTNVNERLSMAVNLIDRQYAVTLNDDDFIIKSSLKKAIKLLESDRSIVACRGQNIHATLSTDKKVITYTFLYNQFKDFQVLDDDLAKRLTTAFSNYNSATSFAVLQSLVWKKTWGALSNSYASTNVLEFFQNIATYCHGKLATIQEPYIITTNENGAINTISDNRSLLISEWWSDEKYLDERLNFIKKLGNLVAQNTMNFVIDPQQLVVDVMNLHVRKSNQKTFLARILFSRAFFYNCYILLKVFLKSIGCYEVYLFLRNRYINKYIERKNKSISELGSLKLKTSIPLEESVVNEVLEIQNILINFHKSEIEF